MIDRPGRDAPRFPAGKEAAAARAIDGVLDEIQADAACIAICGGACGGDLLFAEAAVQRGCAIWLYLPFERAAFIDASVDIAAGDWRRRFEAIERVAQRECVADASPHDPQAFADNNLRMLAAARAARSDGAGLHLICLWDGRGGDGPGGTADMVCQAIESGAVVSRIAPHDLDG
jgi:hypothetical protein